MPCYHPLSAYKTFSGEIVFSAPRSRGYTFLKLPCGRCTGCRLERSRQWAVRCMHEASLYKNNCFITLTYNDENLPYDGSLRLSHLQKFFKRLRKKFGSGIRFYACGEYGEKFGRPHYHAIIFNHDFMDKEVFTLSNGLPVYTSVALDKLWPFGYASIGDVTFESAAYVSRYIMKKVTGDAAAAHYERFNDVTGEVFNIKPEFTTMSKKPGIAYQWFEKYKTDCYPHDLVVMRGKKMKPPRFYDRKFEVENPDLLKKIKKNREKKYLLCIDDNTPDRLRVKERVTELAINKLVRNLPT